jgi:hypothetical protein
MVDTSGATIGTSGAPISVNCANCSGGGTGTGGDVNIAQWAARAVALPTAIGVAPTSGLLPNVNAQILNSLTIGSTTLAPDAAKASNQPAINADGGALAHVQNWPATQDQAGWVPDASYSTPLAVSSTSNSASLPSLATTGKRVIIYNKGPNVLFWTVGNSGVSANNSMSQLPPYTQASFVVQPTWTTVAAVTNGPSLVATLTMESGTGTPQGVGAPINPSANTAIGSAGVAWTNTGATDTANRTTPIRSTPSGTEADYQVGVQGCAACAPVRVTGNIVQATMTPQWQTNTATVREMIPLVAGKAVHLTGWNCVVDGNATATGSCQLVQGTGTNCGTGQAGLSFVYSYPPGAGHAFGGGLGNYLIAAAGQAVCAKTTTTQLVTIGVAADQF